MRSSRIRFLVELACDTNFTKLVQVWIFWLEPRSKLSRASTHSTENYLMWNQVTGVIVWNIIIVLDVY